MLYEAPHRLADTLEDALEILGNRPAVVAREITKVYEEFLRGHMEDMAAAVRKKPARGEITLLIGAAGRPNGAGGRALAKCRGAEPLSHRVEEIMKESGVDRKAALKQAARERGLTRREAYKQLLVTRDEWISKTLRTRPEARKSADASKTERYACDRSLVTTRSEPQRRQREAAVWAKNSSTRSRISAVVCA